MTIHNTDGIDGERLTDGRRLGDVRRIELYALCGERGLLVQPDASADSMRKLISSQLATRGNDDTLARTQRETGARQAKDTAVAAQNQQRAEAEAADDVAISSAKVERIKGDLSEVSESLQRAQVAQATGRPAPGVRQKGASR